MTARHLDYLLPVWSDTVTPPVLAAVRPACYLYLYFLHHCPDWGDGHLLVQPLVVAAELGVSRRTFYRHLALLRGDNAECFPLVRHLPSPMDGWTRLRLSHAGRLAHTRRQLAQRGGRQLRALPAPEGGQSAPEPQPAKTETAPPPDPQLAALLAARDAKLAELRAQGLEVDW